MESGEQYLRSPKVERTLEELYELGENDLLVRIGIDDWGNDDYVPNECVVHFWRVARRGQWANRPSTLLGAALLRRLNRSIWAGCRTKCAGRTDIEREQVEDRVRGFMIDLLCSESPSMYEERIDSYELKFDAHITCRIADAVRRLPLPTAVPLPDGADREVVASLDGVLTGLAAAAPQPLESLELVEGEREAETLNACFSELDEKLGTVLRMCAEDLPWNTSGGGSSICASLGVTEKTARKWRDKAVRSMMICLKRSVR